MSPNHDREGGKRFPANISKAGQRHIIMRDALAAASYKPPGYYKEKREKQKAAKAKKEEERAGKKAANEEKGLPSYEPLSRDGDAKSQELLAALDEQNAIILAAEEKKKKIVMEMHLHQITLSLEAAQKK